MNRFRLIWIWILILKVPLLLWGFEEARIRFPAVKNRVRFLDQILEYRILDANALQIGNLLIDSKEFGLSVDSSTGVPKLIVTGPAQFLNGANLTFRNTVGVTIWKKMIDPVGAISKKGARNFSELRNDILVYESHEALDDLEAHIKNTPFITFCVSNEGENYQYNVCSPNYQIQFKGVDWIIKSIVPGLQEPIIQVNGTEVGDHGQIQLSKEIKLLGFSAKLVSGLRVEIRTKPIKVDIVDYVQDEATGEMVLSAQYHRTQNSTDEWVSRVKLDKPYFFLEGFGQIPLRQNLVFSAPYPKESLRPKINNGQGVHVYGKRAVIEVQKVPGVKLKPMTKGDLVRENQETYDWDLRLKSGRLNAHSVEIQTPETPFLGVIKLRSAEAWEWKMEGNFTSVTATGTKGSGGGFRLQGLYYWTGWWGFEGDWSRLRWNSGLEWSQIKIKQEKSEFSVQDLDFRIGFLTSQSLQYERDTFEVQVHLLRQTRQSVGLSPSVSSMSPGLGVLYKDPLFDAGVLGDRIQIGFIYFPTISSSEDSMVSSRGTLNWESQYVQKKSKLFWYWQMALSLEQSKQLVSPTRLTEQTSASQHMGGSVGLGGNF